MCAVKNFFGDRQIFWSGLCIEDEKVICKACWKEEHKSAKEFIITIERKGISWNKKHTTDASLDRQSDMEAESIWNL